MPWSEHICVEMAAYMTSSCVSDFTCNFLLFKIGNLLRIFYRSNNFQFLVHNYSKKQLLVNEAPQINYTMKVYHFGLMLVTNMTLFHSCICNEHENDTIRV